MSPIKCHDADYLIFSSSDLISNTLFKTGKWDEHLLSISKKLIDKIRQPLILDIGANLGAYSIPMAKYIYDLGGEVIGFEPQRIVYYQLCGNVVLNRLDNYQAIHCAVGDTLGEIEVPDLDYERADNIGSFSLDRDIRKLNGSDRFIKKTSQNVPMITLDSLRLSSLVSLIKIDVEGFELSVLKGASDFISRNNFPPILFEAWNQKWFKSEKTELLNFVSQLGYDIYNFGTSDYIAVRSADVMLSEFDLPGVNIRKL